MDYQSRNYPVSLQQYQELYNREREAIQWGRAIQQQNVHLLSQNTIWQQWYYELLNMYTDLLNTYSRVTNENANTGPVVMENLILQQKVQELENRLARFTQVENNEAFDGAESVTTIAVSEESEEGEGGEEGEESAVCKACEACEA